MKIGMQTGFRVQVFLLAHTPGRSQQSRVAAASRESFYWLKPSTDDCDCCRGLNNYLDHFGRVPCYNHSIIFPQTLFYLLRPLH